MRRFRENLTQRVKFRTSSRLAAVPQGCAERPRLRVWSFSSSPKKGRPIPAPALGRGGRSKLEERTHPHPQASLQLVVRNRIEVSLQVRVIHRLIPGFLTRPNRVHLRYGSRVRLARLRRTNYSVSRSLGYLSNGQLQGKLLSAYKISQAFPGTPLKGRVTRCWYSSILGDGGSPLQG